MLQADKDDVELLGYLKLDVLGVRMLSSMRHCLDEIARTEGVKVDLDEIPLDDLPTFDLIRSSDTLGCFQIESPGQRELLQKLQPSRWKDLIVDISLFRPGPVKSDMVSPYLRRRHGMEPPYYVHDDLRPALQETFGVIVYHEQVMRTFTIMGGYDLSEADRIRRHLDDDLEVDAIERDFLERVRRRGLPSHEAERIWKELRAFASFGFCKAHAAAFAVPTYQSSYLKAHWPAHFLAGVLTHDPGMYPLRLILEDARRRGIPILPLDVNRSEPEYVVEPVVAPVVAAVGAVSATGPSRSRNGQGSPCERDTSGAVPVAPRVPPAAERPSRHDDPYEPDSLRYPGGGGDSSRTDEDAATGSLGDHRKEARVGRTAERGALRRAKRAEGAKRPPAKPSVRGSAPNESATTEAPTTYGIRLALQDVHGISDEEIRSILEARADRAFRSVRDFLRRTRVSKPVVERLAHAGAFDALPDRALSRRDRLYAAMVTAERVGEQLVLPLYDEVGPGLREYSDAERVRAELEVVEMDVSRHLLSFYDPLLEELGVTRARDLWRCRANQEVVVAGVKVASQTPAVRSGQRIIFLTLDDSTGALEVTVFPGVQDRCAKTVFNGFVLAVRGTVRRTGLRGVSVVAEEVVDVAVLAAQRRARTVTSALRGPPPLGPGSAQDRADGLPRPPVKVWHASGGSAGW
jgi:error-prone DNA polymerase